MPATASSEIKKSFDYDSLDSETSKFVQEQTGEIQVLVKRTAETIIKIGQKLIEVKGYLGHGKFGDWLEAEFGWTDRSARNFMDVAKTFKSEIISDLSFDPTALYKLAASSTSELARREAIERAKAGEKITNKIAEELKQKYVSTPQKTNLTPEKELEQLPPPSKASEEIPRAPDKHSKPEIVAFIPRTQEQAKALQTQPKTSLVVDLPSVASEQAETWWLLDGKHLLFCGDPNSNNFLQKAPSPVSLLFGFPVLLDWQPSISAETRYIVCEQQLNKVSKKKGSQDIYDVFELIMLDCSEAGDKVAVCFLPFSVSSLILNITNRLLRRAIIAEPHRDRCRAAIDYWKKAGGKVERLPTSPDTSKPNV